MLKLVHSTDKPKIKIEKYDGPHCSLVNPKPCFVDLSGLVDEPQQQIFPAVSNQFK